MPQVPTKKGLKELEKELTGANKTTKQNNIIKYVGLGLPRAVACRAAMVPLETFMSWLDREPVYRLRVERSEAEIALTLLDKIIAAADKQWVAAAWALERRFSEFRIPKEVPVVEKPEEVNVASVVKSD